MKLNIPTQERSPRGQHPNSIEALRKASQSRPVTKERTKISLDIALRCLVDERCGQGRRSDFINEAIRLVLSNPQLFNQVEVNIAYLHRK
jgi:hypothetical protein